MRRISLLVTAILLLPVMATFGDELKSEEGFDSSFGFMPAEFDFKHAREAGAYWDRPFFELFEWGIIEPEQGRFNFHMTDRYIRRAQRYDFHLLANIQPFAPWDQELCHRGLPTISTPMGPQTKGKPCNIEAYKNFVIKLVERYDGDGQDDMPGLKYPIKYWEVANEPEMQRQPLVFFQGSPQDYFEILKATYEAVKKADSQAQVLQGGMAGMDRWMVSFWQKVFDLGAPLYFDIANMHSIAHGEHLNIPSFKKFLSKNNASEKPFWITEVQIEERKKKRKPKEYAASLARSYIFALANGAKKLFYVNLRLPEHLPPEEEGGPGFSDLSTLVDSSGNLTPLFYAHHTIALKLEDFKKVEKIKERIRGKTILKGQYRFIKDNKVIYVLWGRGNPPSEIEGKVKVTDISGSEKILGSDSIRLTNSPIFVEEIEPQSETLTVIQVIDGDTCLLEDGRRVRYLGINAPERDEALFEEATRANNKLVGGKEIRLEPCDPSQDKEGRLLAYVFVGETFVNEELVRWGYAHIQRPLAEVYWDIFLEAQQEAQIAGRGIWAKVAGGRHIAVAMVHADAEGLDRQNLGDEYIVIENRGDEPVNLTGWTVSDEASHRYLFPKFILGAKAKITLRTGLGKNTNLELFWGSRRPIWNNDGDTIFIRDASGNLILSYVY